MPRTIDLARPRRYATVGALCAAMNNVLLIGGEFAGLHYTASSLLAFAVVTPTAYWLHAAHTFREPLSWRGLGRFTAGLLMGLMIFFLVIALLCSVLELPMIVAAPIATLILFVWNYVSARWAIVARLAPRSS